MNSLIDLAQQSNTAESESRGRPWSVFVRSNSPRSAARYRRGRIVEATKGFASLSRDRDRRTTTTGGAPSASCDRVDDLLVVRMIPTVRLSLALFGLAMACITANVVGQPIKIGELNSYKAQPSFLEPYKKGWQLAMEEINAAGGLLGRKVEVVSRDDLANPGDAVRVAEDLVSRDRVELLFGTFLSNVGLAITDFAKHRKILFLAAEPLTDKITWQNGNRYTFRLAPSTYMQVAMLVPEAVKMKRKRWALVYPNYEYGQSAAETFKRLLKAAQPDVEFVVEQTPALG